MKCIKISNKPITARHLTLSSTSSIGKNACNKTGHEPMFRSINRARFSTKIHEFKCKLKLQLCFNYTNNMAEYEACIMGLRAAIDLRIKFLSVFGDSALVISQIKGSGIRNT